MSSTSTTQYYGLTQYVGTDKPDFADNNTAFREVDAALHGVVQDAEGFATDITNLQTDVAAAQSDITTLQTDLDTAEAAIVTINNKDLAQDAEISRVDTNSKDMITAYNEASATSAHAYAIGDYFIYNNVLYRATAAIAIGETIVPDTNCTTTNVTSELIQLNSDLDDLNSKSNTRVNLPSGWHSGGSGYVDFFKSGNIVEARITNLSAGQSGSEVTNLFQIPEDFRPHSDIMWYLISPNTGGVNGRLNMKSNGVVDAYFYTSGDVNVTGVSITFIHSMS